MAKNIFLKVTKKMTEKNWSAGPNDKNKNSHTIEFEVPHNYEAEDPEENEHAGSSLSLRTTNQKLADSYKIGDEHELSLKKK